MSNPFFSIVIPTYNRADFVQKTVQSFLRQTFTDFEILIIDDGGSDDTKLKIESLNDSRVKYYWKENGERGAARKFGAAHAKGTYINYFDSDDIAYDHHLQTATDAIRELNEPMIFHLGYEMKNEKGETVHTHKALNGVGNANLLRVNYVNPNPVFVHRKTLAEVNYSEDRGLSATEDWLYHLQLAARYDFNAFDETITSCMIEHSGRSMNISTGDNVMLRALLLVKYLRADDIFMKKYGQHISNIYGETISLAALHFALEGNKMKAVKFSIQAIAKSPRLLFKRRIFAILKYIMTR